MSINVELLDVAKVNLKSLDAWFRYEVKNLDKLLGTKKTCKFVMIGCEYKYFQVRDGYFE